MKVIREFWVTNEHLDKINKNEETAVIIRNKDESNFNDSVTSKAINKITISYDIDREIAIKESEFEDAFKGITVWDHDLIKVGVMDKVKQKLFGDK